MLENRNYKKELIIAAIVICMCMVSVVGTTFALFTNDLANGTIGINVTGGDIIVDIQDTAGNTLVNDVLDFVTTAVNPKLYWEPGVTFYTQGFKVTNEGEISIKFTAYIEKGHGDIDLIDALEFYIISEEDLGNLQNAERLESFEGYLKSNQSSGIYHLVVHMKEEAGNKYQGLKLTGVGITVMAVQGNVNLDHLED